MPELRRGGPARGAAILGTVLNSAYQARLDVAGLPATVAGAARSGVSGGVEVARRLGSAPLLHSVETAFVHGMDVMLWCCAGIALAAAVLALAFLPRRAGAPGESPQAGRPQAGAAMTGVPATPGDGAGGEGQIEARRPPPRRT